MGQTKPVFEEFDLRTFQTVCISADLWFAYRLNTAATVLALLA